MYDLYVHIVHMFIYFFILTIIWQSPVAAVNTNIWWQCMTCKPFVHNADQEQMDIMHFYHILLNILETKH